MIVTTARDYTKAINWTYTILEHAKRHSKDPNTKVAAAVLRPDWSLVSMGYNGMPMGVPDDDANWERPRKYDLVIHAEANAFRFAREDLSGHTLVCNLFPCHRCAGEIVQHKLARIFYKENPRLDHNSELAMYILKKSTVQLIQVTMPD